MPAANPPIHAHPAAPFRTLIEAARAGQVLTLKCGLCGRTMSYLACDLAEVVGPKWPAHKPPFGCKTCGDEYMRMKWWVPCAQDLGKVAVRRPFRQVQKWRTEMLGDRRWE